MSATIGGEFRRSGMTVNMIAYLVTGQNALHGFRSPSLPHLMVILLCTTEKSRKQVWFL